MRQPRLVVAALGLSACARLVGFDPGGELIYDHPLITFSYTAIKRAEYQFVFARGESPHQFVAHPLGKKILLVGEKKLLFVKLN